MAQATKTPPTVVSGNKAQGTKSGLPMPAILCALRRRWWIILLVAGMGGFLASWYAEQVLPRVSTVRTLVYVTARRPVLLHEGLERREDTSSYQREQLGLL